MGIDYLLALLICILSFLVWVGSLIVLIVVKKNNSAPPETVRLRKRAKGRNIALISVTLFGSFIFFFSFLGLVMLVLSVLCIIDSVKLISTRARAQQLGQQNYQLPQQTGGIQQPQQAQFQQTQYQQTQYQQAQYQQAQPQQEQQSLKCPHCGAEIEAGCYFCVHCGKKL